MSLGRSTGAAAFVWSLGLLPHGRGSDFHPWSNGIGSCPVQQVRWGELAPPAVPPCRRGELATLLVLQEAGCGQAGVELQA